MTDPAASVQIGDVLAGKYEIVDHIGQGGMGFVFEGLHRGLGQRVAVKVLRRQKGHDEEMIARFEREARAAAKLKSEHTARVMDVDTLRDGTPFMVMELLDGHDLEAELCRFGRLPIAYAVDLVLQACSAMAEAHQRGIVHRDLKPPNLFLCEQDGQATVKILDFGISKMEAEGQKSVTQTSSSLGTPLYMSPEQIRSAKHVDERTDIWSLGVILYELIAGRTPFEADSPTAVIAAITADPPLPLIQAAPEVPERLSLVVMKALEKHPDRRWRTVDAFAQALVSFGSAGAYVPAPRGSLPSTTGERAQTMSSAPTVVSSAGSNAARETHSSWETARLARPRGKTVALGALMLAAIGAVAGAMLWLAGGDDRAESSPVAAEPVSGTSGPDVPAPVVSQTDDAVAAPESESSATAAPTATPDPTASASSKPAPVPQVVVRPRVPIAPPVVAPPKPPPPVAPAPAPTKNPTHL